MTVFNAPIPLDEPIAEVEYDKRTTLKGYLTNAWTSFLTEMLDALDLAPGRIGSASLTEQGASIGATDLTDGTAGAGVYRLTYYARISRAATTSSTLTVTLAWTDGGVSQSASGSAMTGNTTATHQSGTYLLYSDGASPITYATTYGSVGGTSMQYRLNVTLERVLT